MESKDNRELTLVFIISPATKLRLPPFSSPDYLVNQLNSVLFSIPVVPLIHSLFQPWIPLQVQVNLMNKHLFTVWNQWIDEAVNASHIYIFHLFLILILSLLHLLHSLNLLNLYRYWVCLVISSPGFMLPVIYIQGFKADLSCSYLSRRR